MPKCIFYLSYLGELTLSNKNLDNIGAEYNNVKISSNVGNGRCLLKEILG